ncbi:MAG: hypothetical protein QNJ46_30080 [Leptolyngbyaceae cyanobacterium MO_188.B28]|nr:hypothetical protein [Leptolyngbyaceae cyanobacterium MO_188.B28]
MQHSANGMNIVTLFKPPLKVWGEAIYGYCRHHWRDILILLTLALLGGGACYWGSQWINPGVLDSNAASAWFEADVPRVFENMTDRHSNHYRTKVHPLFSLLAFPPVFALQKAFQLTPLQAVNWVMAGMAALWIGLLFVLLRSLNCRRGDAVLFSLLGATSAAAVFWFVVPETYPFGSVTILAALLFASLAQTKRLSSLGYVAISAATLSMTITNWMVGILTALVNQPRKRAAQLSINAFCLVTVLWGVQKFLFTTSVFFLGDREEQQYVLDPDAGGPLQIVQSFFAHAQIMPAIRAVDKFNRPEWPVLTTQLSSPGSASFWGAAGVVVWLALLGLGFWSLFSLKQHPKFRLVLGLSLLGQLALHLVYGDETFLYSLHFAPLLLIVAALTTLTPYRRWGLLLASGVLLCTVINNYQQFVYATDFAFAHGTPRQQVQGQMHYRPQDPWPRGVGHVVLATPGSREEDKAYHEPGGSFSPSVDSFGVSIWVMDGQGNFNVSSDQIPLKEIEQRWVERRGGEMPAVATQTKFYQGTWSEIAQGRWRLDLQIPDGGKTQAAIALRSVGPAGGPIHSLDWNDQQLTVNDRWTVEIDPTPKQVVLGHEGDKGWKDSAAAAAHWEGEDGWGYARLDLGDGTQWHVTLTDLTPPSPNDLQIQTLQPTPQLDIPDDTFQASVQAQVAHLMMGLVGRQTRPGEPTNYPLPWQRDGAYELVALARAGQLDVAQELSAQFAEEDFFGGFGPEADAPGLSIWALAEVASQVKDPAYDQQLWPYIKRKAEFILKMLSAEEPIYQGVTAPIVPKMEGNPELTLVAEPAQDGLIMGKMDNHRPILFINAVSYRGLLDAAAWAERLGQTEERQRWRIAAQQLQQAWQKGFKPPESNNERTYISALWPTWVADGIQDKVAENLQARWRQLHDDKGAFRQTPLWTYFDLAEAHQWLFLNQPEEVWRTLEWFWDHQSSPGLYTWWEGDGEENASGRWEQVRGWVDPPHVTPHYWTAAEMLLLQLDMLAYVDPTADQPTLVVGAGVLTEWLDQPIGVEGILTGPYRVDWRWDGQTVKVTVQGPQAVQVKLGPAFPKTTPVTVTYQSA